VVPGSWLSVLLFVVLVAPGLLFDLLSDRRRGGFPESTFREISRVVLASFWFSVLPFGVLVLLRTVEPGWMPDPRRLLGSSRTYVPDQYRLILRALLIQAGLALLLAFLSHLWLARQHGATVQRINASMARQLGGKIRRINGWSRVFDQDCPIGDAPYVRVRLKSGYVYTGFVGQFSPDFDLDSRELVLLPPLYSKPPEGKLTVMPTHQQRVIFRGSEIDMISVEYRPDPTKAASDGNSPNGYCHSPPRRGTWLGAAPPSSGIRANRRQEIESATSRHRLS
jgi:hypothetical protein